MYEKKQAYFIFIVGVIILIAVIVWFVCAGRCDVSNLRTGADTVRNELDNARTAQQGQVDTLRQASEATERSAGAVENSKRANQEISSIERTDAELIRESKSILERVRARGGTESKD
jgi:hypothetical protein